MSQFGFGWSDLGWLILVLAAFPAAIVMVGLPIVAVVAFINMVLTRL